MTKYLFLARKVHRIFVWAVIILGSVMGATGTMLKFGIGDFTVRLIHSNLSLFFSFSFGVMAVTGIIMYFTPALARFFKKD